MLPPAPGLFSITTCWPQISESRAPMMRPMLSMPPPGVNGTTSLMTRLGQPSAEGAVRPPATGRAHPRPPARSGGADRSSRLAPAISFLDLDFRVVDDGAPFVH